MVNVGITNDINLSFVQNKDTRFNIDVGEPEFHVRDIGVNWSSNQMIDSVLQVGEGAFLISAVKVQHSFIVLFIPDFNRLDFLKIGAKIASHALLTADINIVFVQVQSRDQASILMYDSIQHQLGFNIQAVAAALSIGVITHRLNYKAVFSYEGLNLKATWREFDNHILISK
ncbi:MAG: hypothetical protein ACRDD8_03100 [Bacteroidales bacterium]